MDPISLSLSVAALFKTCIDCFEYFRAASDFTRDYEVLLVKLEFEQERLLAWGDLVGIAKEDSTNTNTKAAQPDLVRRSLESIGNLLQDTETLKSKYGVRPVNPSDRVLDQNGDIAGTWSIEKTRWAIYDAAKFGRLISNVRYLVDILMEKAPAPQHTLNKTINDDIAIMIGNISGLRLVQEACEETYPEWSDAASVAIDVSEAATVNDSLADERVAQFDPLVSTGVSSSVDERRSSALPGKQISFRSSQTKIFLVSTEQCDSRNKDSPCDQMNLGPLAFQAQHSFVADFSNFAHTSPGHRITKHIDPQSFTEEDLEGYLITREKLRMQTMKNGEYVSESPTRFVLTIYLYCPPCACQIATALDICQNFGNSPFLEFIIRIDHLLPSTCCASAPGLDGMCSIIDHLNNVERYKPVGDNHAISQIKSIDREWLEERVYAAEDIKILSSEARLAQIAQSHFGDQLTAAIVIMGEADFCMRVMNTSAFPPFESGHKFRENMMFEFSQQWSISQKRYWERRYLGTYSTKAPIVRNGIPLGKRPAETVEQPDKRPRTSLQG